MTPKEIRTGDLFLYVIVHASTSEVYGDRPVLLHMTAGQTIHSRACYFVVNEMLVETHIGFNYAKTGNFLLVSRKHENTIQQRLQGYGRGSGQYL